MVGMGGDSTPRPFPPQANALAGLLLYTPISVNAGGVYASAIRANRMVGMTGFEPATSSTPRKRACRTAPHPVISMGDDYR